MVVNMREMMRKSVADAGAAVNICAYDRINVSLKYNKV